MEPWIRSGHYNSLELHVYDCYNFEFIGFVCIILFHIVFGVLIPDASTVNSLD